MADGTASISSILQQLGTPVTSAVCQLGRSSVLWPPNFDSFAIGDCCLCHLLNHTSSGENGHYEGLGSTPSVPWGKRCSHHTRSGQVFEGTEFRKIVCRDLWLQDSKDRSVRMHFTAGHHADASELIRFSTVHSISRLPEQTREVWNQSVYAFRSSIAAHAGVSDYLRIALTLS